MSPTVIPEQQVPETTNGQLAAAAKKPSNSGLIVLQWLTYAFWGWTLLALSALTAAVITNFIDSSQSTGTFTTYGIAAVLVLLPISFICDKFYAKREPENKEGAATWVMVIHAVIFALFTIGALISAVIALVMLFTNNTGTTGATIIIISSLIIAGFYALTFLRTLNPAMFRVIQRSYKYIMLALVGLIVLLGIVGPVARERATRDDRLIVSELSSLTTAIADYSRENKALPKDLGELELRDDTRQLVDRKLVEYKPEGAAPVDINDPDSVFTRKKITTMTYRYQLCVNYEQKTKDTYSYADTGNKDSEGYASYISAYDHPAGDVCYKIKTTDF